MNDLETGVSNLHNKEYLTREETSVYLSDVIGIPVSVKHLSKLITTGGGPVYRKWGRRVVYPRKDIIDWCEKKLSPVYENSTQEVIV